MNPPITLPANVPAGKTAQKYAKPNYASRPAGDPYADRVELSTAMSRDAAVELVTDFLYGNELLKGQDLDRGTIKDLVQQHLEDKDHDGYFDLSVSALYESLNKELDSPIFSESLLYKIFTYSPLPNNIRFNTFITDAKPDVKPATEDVRLLDKIGIFNGKIDPLNADQVTDKFTEWGKKEGLFMMRDGKIARNPDGSPIFSSEDAAITFFKAWQAYFRVCLQGDQIDSNPRSEEYHTQAGLRDSFTADYQETQGLAKTTKQYNLDGKIIPISCVKVDCAGYAAFANRMAGRMGFKPETVYAVIRIQDEVAGHAVSIIQVKADGRDLYIGFNNERIMKSLASIEELGGIEPTALDMIDRSCQGICSVNYVTTDIAKFHGNYRILLAISSVDNTALPQLDVLTTPSIQYANLTYALGMDDYDFNQYVDDYYAELASKQPNASRRNPVQNPPGMFVLDAPLDSPEFAAAIYPLLRSDVTATRNFAYRTLRTKMVQEVKKEAMDQLQKLKSINPEQFVYPISISIQSYEYPAEADSQPRAMLRTREYKFDSAETFKRFLDKRIGDLESALH